LLAAGGAFGLAFLATGFFAAGFLAAGFFAAGFLAAGFFAAGFFLVAFAMFIVSVLGVATAKCRNGWNFDRLPDYSLPSESTKVVRLIRVVHPTIQGNRCPRPKHGT
jgi:hypothetical protein